VRRERSGRRGKTVTVVHPLQLSRDAAESLLRELKQRCGSGGTLRPEPARDGRAAFALELQGDHVDVIVAELSAAGFDAKRAGG
jgi:translation initiation factor 1